MQNCTYYLFSTHQNKTIICDEDPKTQFIYNKNKRKKRLVSALILLKKKKLKLSYMSNYGRVVTFRFNGFLSRRNSG